MPEMMPPSAHSSLPQAPREVPGHGLALSASLVLVAVAVAWFHDRFWYPPDEGVYAYLAQRILDGAVLSGDVQDIHAGYVDFVNAASLWLFGHDLVSLRYPLAVLTVVQSALAYILLARRGVAVAFAGAVGIGVLSFIQFLNPSANWYALFLAVAVTAAMAGMRSGMGRDVAVGALVALVFLFRQLSGVFAAMGVLTWLLVEMQGEGGTQPRLARMLLAVMAFGLAAYLLGKGSVTAAVMFGVWPLAALGLAWRRVCAADRAVAALVARLALGAVGAAAPLLLYHLWHGTLGTWFGDTVLAAAGLNRFAFFGDASYVLYPLIGVAGLVAEPGVARALNLFFWLVLLALPLLAGWWFAAAARAGNGEAAWHPLPVMALFYGVAAAHYQIPAYLMSVIGLTLLAVLWLGSARAPFARGVLVAVTLSVSGVAVAYQAGEPLSRGLVGTLAGRTVPLDAGQGIPGARLAMEARDAATYRRLLGLIADNAGPADTILAVPMNPELYFLSGRRPPFRFFSTALGLRNATDAAEAAAVIDRHPPKVVVFDPGDKYNTPESRAVMDDVRQRYRLATRVGRFEVYLPRLPTATPAS